jgi:hypothetical protein
MSAPILFDADAMESVLSSLMDGHCEYLMDGMKGKVADLTSDPENVKKLDCSGFVEYVFYKITNPGKHPLGSSNQIWFKNAIRACRTRKRPVRQYPRMFRDTTKKQPVRHVWFIVNGCTIESTRKAGNHGPTSFPDRPSGRGE